MNPQGKSEVIYFYLKDEEHGWLSNFWPSPFIAEDGKTYPTVEHYYQSRKTTDLKVREWIRLAPKPYLAMKAGRNLRDKDGLPEDWDEYKDICMMNALRMKFSSNAELARKLMATGQAILGEDSPTDMYWGRRGKNVLGNLLMRLRNELSEELSQ